MEKKNLKKKSLIGSPINRKRTAKSPSKTKAIGAFVLLALGVILMPTGFVLADIIQDQLDEGIADQVSVPTDDDSDEYDEWITNDYEDAPQAFKSFYLWDLQNPEGFLAGEKGDYAQVGPFVFRDLSYKYGVEFSDDEEEVTYKQYHNYVQVAGEDISTVNITNINPAYVSSLVVAGGTEEQYMQLVFPLLLDLLVEIFEEKFPVIMAEDVFTSEGISDLFSDAIDILLYEVIEEFIWDTFGPILGTPIWLAYNSLLAAAETAAWFLGTSVTNLIVDIVMWLEPLDTLVTMFEASMPPVEDIIFEKWANDFFPELDMDMSMLFMYDEDNPPPGTQKAILDLMAWMYDVIPGVFDFLGDEFLAPAFQRACNDLVNNLCSEGGEGIDVDWYECGISGTDPKDISMVVYEDLDPDVLSGISYDQCVALWDKTDHYSLTGMDYELGEQIWFDAIDGDDESKNFLMDRYELGTTQLNYILDWTDLCTHTWGVNAIRNQYLNEWNCFVYTTRTVEEWLFTANDTAAFTHTQYYQRDFGREMIGFLPAFFGHCENSLEAEEKHTPSFTIKTGKGNVDEVGQILERNGQDTISIWAEPIDIKGTNGMVNGPGVTSEDTLEVFATDLMRTVELEFDKETEIYDIDLLRFEFATDTFAPNPTYYMDTSLINMAPVANLLMGVEAPVFISRPHFLGASTDLINAVNGMHPDGSLHDTYVDVEPITGMAMNARQRVQLNFEVPKSNVYLEDILSTTVVPIFWTEDKAEIPEDMAEEFVELVYGALEAKKALPTVCLGLGAALCVPGVAVTRSQKVRRTVSKKGLMKGDKLSKQRSALKRQMLLRDTNAQKPASGIVPKPNGSNTLGLKNDEKTEL